jgi:hypothetical protein
MHGQGIRLRFLARATDYSLLHSFQTCSETHLVSCLRVAGISPVIKHPGREADHSSPSSTKDKNTGAITSLFHRSSWHGVYLIIRKEIFTSDMVPKTYEEIL